MWKGITVARLAQSVEHETLNLRVVGSSPTLGDTFCLTLIHAGGGKSAIRLRNHIITVGTEWKMELRIGCKFKFIYWREPKKKKLDQTDHLGTLADHFCRQDPKFF